jgi:REP-associated tyrosine transposase
MSGPRAYLLGVAEGRYAENAGAVFSLKYHVVWCPKYRRSVLTGKIAERLAVMIGEIAGEIGASVQALEVMPDHVHLFIESDPRWAVAGIVSRIKGRTSRQLRHEFPELRSRLPTLWSRSYYAGTVGHVSEQTVRRYIDGQKGR